MSHIRAAGRFLQKTCVKMTLPAPELASFYELRALVGGSPAILIEEDLDLVRKIVQFVMQPA
jgi:hypothetical protein